MTQPSGAGPLTEAQVEAVVERWRQGRLVALPTETVYGLAGDAGQERAVAEIFRIKGRPADHPLIVHVGSPADADYWIDAQTDASRLARFRTLVRQFWPGPLTLIMPRRPQAPAFACGGQASVGLRCPSHPVAQRLLAAFAAADGHGIAAPSANRFGRISPTRAAHVRDEFGDADILIVDGGDSEVGLESTIVDLSRDRPSLLRPGSVALQAIEQALGEPVAVSANVADPSVVDADAPRASGTLASHYAPHTEMRIVSADELPARLAAAQADAVRAVVLPCAGDAAAYGRRLYARLRELDGQGADLILVVAPPRQADWQAIWDRLLRASTRDA